MTLSSYPDGAGDAWAVSVSRYCADHHLHWDCVQGITAFRVERFRYFVLTKPRVQVNYICGM